MNINISSDTISLQICKRVHIYFGLGRIYNLKYKYKKSFQAHRKSLEMNRREGAKLEEIKVLAEMGNVYINTIKFDKDTDLSPTSLWYDQRNRKQTRWGGSVNEVGINTSKHGAYETSIEKNELAIAIAKEIGDLRIEGRCLGNIGSVYRLQQYTDKAIQTFKKAIDIGLQVNNKRGLSVYYGGMHWHIKHRTNMRMPSHIIKKCFRSVKNLKIKDQWEFIWEIWEPFTKKLANMKQLLHFLNEP